MAPWQQAAVGAAVFIAVHYLFLRAASGKIPDTLGALVLEATAAAGILANYFFGPKGDAVATTTRAPVRAACRATRTIIGTPSRSTSGFPGNRVDP